MQFDFGKNWKAFAKKALDQERFESARKEFSELFKNISLHEKTFLDIGFGQGISLLLAHENGAIVCGCDINSRCTDALRRSTQYSSCKFEELQGKIITGSILDGNCLKAIRFLSNNADGKFDIVHSWGVLHHTGNMKLALNYACALVKDGAYLILALYNEHWSSRTWKYIKYVYNVIPNFLKSLVILSFIPPIYIAKLIVTSKSPIKQKRGMVFFYNVVDWVGGYPYEYASIEKVVEIMRENGFECIRTIPAEVPTGCNEFVFKKQ